MIHCTREFNDRERFIFQLTVMLTLPNSHLSRENKEMLNKLFRVASGLTDEELTKIHESVHNEFDKLESFFAEAFGIRGRCNDCRNE